MIEQIFGRDARIDAEVLGQITELRAQPHRLGQNVDPVERDASRARLLQGGEDAHQGRLAGAVAQQAIHPPRDVQGHAGKRPKPVGIGCGRAPAVAARRGGAQAPGRAYRAERGA